MQLLPWACSILHTIILALLPTFGIIVLQLFGIIKVPLPSLMINLVLMCLSGLCVAGDALLAWVTGCIVPMFNFVNFYEIQMRSSNNQYY